MSEKQGLVSGDQWRSTVARRFDFERGAGLFTWSYPIASADQSTRSVALASDICVTEPLAGKIPTAGETTLFLALSEALASRTMNRKLFTRGLWAAGCGALAAGLAMTALDPEGFGPLVEILALCAVIGSLALRTG